MSKLTKGFTVVEALLVVAVLTIIVVPIAIGVTAYLSSQHQQTITVNKSERIVDNGGKSSRYLIYTKQGVYQDTDTLLFGKFNSSDLYSQLQQNKTYSCLTVGWRVPFLSWYPNLIKCQETR